MGIRISELPSNTLPYSGTDQIPIVQNSVTRAATLSSLVTYLSSSANYAFKDAANIFTATQSIAGDLSAQGKIVVGTNNIYTDTRSSILGGVNNTASGTCSSVVGGFSSRATCFNSNVGGGINNIACGITISNLG